MSGFPPIYGGDVLGGEGGGFFGGGDVDPFGFVRDLGGDEDAVSEWLKEFPEGWTEPPPSPNPGVAAVPEAGGGLAAEAIEALGEAAVLALVIEIGLVIDGFSTLSAKADIQKALDAINDAVNKALETLRGLKAKGVLTPQQYQDLVNRLGDQAAAARAKLDARNNALQDELNNNLLVRIGDWLFSSVPSRNPQPPLKSAAMSPWQDGPRYMRAESFIGALAAFKAADPALLAKIDLGFLASGLVLDEPRIARALAGEAEAEHNDRAFRLFSLRILRRLNTLNTAAGKVAEAPGFSFWRAIADHPDPLFRIEAILAFFGSPLEEAAALCANARNDADKCVRVFAWEISASQVKHDLSGHRNYLAAAATALAGNDTWAKVGALFGIIFLPITTESVGVLSDCAAKETNRFIASFALAILGGKREGPAIAALDKVFDLRPKSAAHYALVLQYQAVQLATGSPPAKSKVGTRRPMTFPPRPVPAQDGPDMASKG